MKKNTLIACLAIALSASSISIAQTLQDREKIIQGYDLVKSKKLTQEIKSYTKENYDRAMRLAQRHGWPLTIEYKDGGFGELVGVLEDDSPLYYRTYNKGGVSTIHADAVHTGGSAGLDLNGENMIAGVWDGGTVRSSHVLFEGRVVKKDNSADQSHGTHVAGTIIGSATINNGRAVGVAPQATVYSYDWNNDYAEMISAAQSGLLVSNHSYGIATTDYYGNPIPASYFGKYDAGSQYLDNMLYQLEYYLTVWAAGNDRSDYSILNPGKSGYDLLTREGNSKNNLVVGSIRQIDNYTNPSQVRISSFSNYGPTDDGRIKPDITAKGDEVYSATAISDWSYGTMYGTSMAAPSAAGGLVLMQQHANETYGDYLRSATLRALVAHTALKAGSEGSPNYRFGWGVMNVEGATNIITNDGDSTLLKEMKLIDGQNYLRSLEASEVEDLIATIAWTDLPGETSQGTDDRTPVLVNDLDIRLIEIEGDTYYPYVLDPNNPSASATTGDNFRDNIEKIEVSNPEGEYNLSISHKGILEEGEQKLSLIMSGITNKPLVLETYDNNKYICVNSVDENAIELLVSSEYNIENTVLTVQDAPQGVTVIIDDSDLGNGIVTLNISGLLNLNSDTYVFKIKAVNGADEAHLYPVINIANDLFEPVELVSPENGEDMLRNFARLVWNPVNDARVISYTVEIATDEDFVNILDVIEDIEGDYHLYRGVNNQGIAHDTDYYWRVKAIGECGEGEYSDTYVFHTYDLSVEDFKTTDFVVHPNPATNQVTISSPTLIKEVKVMNVLGQEVMVLNPNTDQTLIDISVLPSGNYLLQISDDTTTQVKRLIKR
ncbi:MAG TPA: S8 family serine peptidase [Flavobacteriaceae bacterium]|nr:S8 family serine peptidase [Flavobacteriaceae bacterium]